MGNSHGSIEVHLWTIALTDPRPEILSADEAARAARFHFNEDRIRWTRAHSALRTILAACVNQPPDSLTFDYGEHGKPMLQAAPEIHFNLSHAGDYAMVAVSHKAPVGVDIERLRPNVDIAALLRRLGEEDLPATDFELYQRWTRREAATKATGSPLFRRPSEDIQMAAVAAPAGYAASIAAAGPPPHGGIMIRSRGFL